MFAADLTKVARNDRCRTQLRQVRGQVLARYLSRVAAVRTRQQEPRTLVVVILHIGTTVAPPPPRLQLLARAPLFSYNRQVVSLQTIYRCTSVTDDRQTDDRRTGDSI